MPASTLVMDVMLKGALWLPLLVSVAAIFILLKKVNAPSWHFWLYAVSVVASVLLTMLATNLWEQVRSTNSGIYQAAAVGFLSAVIGPLALLVVALLTRSRDRETVKKREAL